MGDWVVARSEGALEIEYALFDASEVILAAPSGGVGVREQGYLTTASIARDRLARAGATTELASAAFRSLGSCESLARTAAVMRVAAQLGPCEAFQGGVYNASTRHYVGTWLDLAAIADACPMERGAFALQLVHLAMVLAEVPDDTPLRLLTDPDRAKANQRTWRRVGVEAIEDLPHALALTKRPIDARRATNEAEADAEIVTDLRARAALSQDRPRLHALASALSRRPPSNPVQAAALPDVIVADEHAEHAPAPLIDELRAHTAMLHGETRLREVAQFLTAMAGGDKPESELAVLAARAWLASGEIAYARYFARRVSEDPVAGSSARISAVEILESTAKTNESMRPPPTSSMKPPGVVVISDRPAVAPAGASLPPAQAIPSAPAMPHIEGGARSGAEVVETMAIPEGDDARAKMTQLARELARDYRLSYGTTLKTDPVAIEAMQRHLRRRFGDAKRDERQARMLETELTRHGALLSEILARRLGAQWIETQGDEPGRWSMMVPPTTRVWPIGRVYRFFQQGSRESDLVAFYLELERAARG